MSTRYYLTDREDPWSLKIQEFIHVSASGVYLFSRKKKEQPTVRIVY